MRQRLIADVPSARPARRPLIQRQWDASSAQDWSREDWIAIVVSPIVFGCMLIGLTKLLLLQPDGIWLVLAAVAGMGIIYWVIDPKLRAVSEEYERAQSRYLDDLEHRVRWQEQEAR